ncbi:glycerophosphodiester phosphodiesterase family protein [Antarcticirhabdus aurantiaca]|uniref:Glycerophosphodiester phosphodiesterase family protein n=1 Tax=Antarcticirhabdus aurantiaca TaxID=2606717 RepID=A0ACD4NVP7_9HYPH|nr:glycerophosphodiester phosphodiesterase family protein [Antarcticirhabdus aurantiaca]WAJ30868.1 glycerophosphodiester phosphodiesterase family protein [Jeongeuplla avenae]
MADLSWLTARPIAHRGLHDGNRAVYENSLAAALLAIDEGFAIECDVQLSADGTPHIFHDDTLDRLTSATGRIRAQDDAAIAALRLGETAEGIPTVAAFLDAVAGRVPILMELKGESAEADGHYVPAIKDLVDAYDGPLALMSFDAWLVEGVIAAGVERPVGLTAEGTSAAELERHRALYDKGCTFTSYSVHHLPNAFTSHVREGLGAPVLTWTVRTLEERDWSRLHADQMTFEGFRPQA